MEGVVIHIGTSGWQYRDWRGRFYPRELPQRLWLEHYAARFSTVEVNNTFYRLPEAAVFEDWRERTPEGFIVTVKASRFLTHMKRLRDPSEPLQRLLSRARKLGPKLGPVLYQMPPRFPVDTGLLREFLSVLPDQPRAAFEFRDPSWQTDEVLQLIDGAGAAWVLADRPGARVEPIVTGGWTYVRFHQGTETGPDYRLEKLRRWADRIAQMPIEGGYGYFNNDPGAAAVRDAERFREMLADRTANEPSAMPRGRSTG
jgi:uncharacterized protein YecE (DUF72 family)